MKDELITITKSDGSKEIMKILFAFKPLETGKNYMVYRSLADKSLYGASFEGDVKEAKLNTDLTLEEKIMINEMYIKLKKGGKLND